MGRTVLALLLAATLCRAAVRGTSPAASHVLPRAIRGGGNWGEDPPTQRVLSAGSNETSQIVIREEGGVDGDTTGPPPEKTEGAPVKRSLLWGVARRATRAMTFWAAGCAPFLRKADGQVECDGPMPASLTLPGRRKDDSYTKQVWG